MNVRERLASLGTNCSLGEFAQVEFAGRYAEIEGVDIADGYCAGVALDWTRRVLQSDPNRNAKYLSYSSDKNSQPSGVGSDTRQTQTLRRMAVAYYGHGLSYVATTRKDAATSTLTALLRLPEREYAPGKRGVPVSRAQATVIMEVIALNPNNTPFSQSGDPAGHVPHTRLQTWLNNAGNYPEVQRSPRADGGREWGQYAKELDDDFSQNKKRKFGLMHVVTSSNQQTYGSPDVWHGELLANAFLTDCCTIVGVSVPRDEGHAVAVHQIGNDYRFFDPNYGVYKYSRESLSNALKHLFCSPIGDDGVQDAELPAYRRRTNKNPQVTEPWTQMAYTIFARNG